METPLHTKRPGPPGRATMHIIDAIETRVGRYPPNIASGSPRTPDIQRQQSAAARLGLALLRRMPVRRAHDIKRVERVAAEAAAGRARHRQFDGALDAAVRRVARQAFAGELGVPEKALGVDAGAVRQALARGEIGEHALVRDRAGRDVEIERPDRVPRRIGEIHGAVVRRECGRVRHADAVEKFSRPSGRRRAGRSCRVGPRMSQSMVPSQNRPRRSTAAVVVAVGRRLRLRMEQEVEPAALRIEAVQPVVHRQHEAAGGAQRRAAAVRPRQRIDLVRAARRVERLQAGLEDVEPPDLAGARAPDHRTRQASPAIAPRRQCRSSPFSPPWLPRL